MRFTIRSNTEFMVTDQARVAPLIEALEAAGFPVGGIANSVSMIAHTQGWLHCDIPGTDASGIAKSQMGGLYAQFVHERMPDRVRLSTSCCQINCDLVANICERLSVVARCPVAAVVKRILRCYQEDGRDWERLGEWIERLGWSRFFEITDLPFTPLRSCWLPKP